MLWVVQKWCQGRISVNCPVHHYWSTALNTPWEIDAVEKIFVSIKCKGRDRRHAVSASRTVKIHARPEFSGECWMVTLKRNPYLKKRYLFKIKHSTISAGLSAISIPRITRFLSAKGYSLFIFLIFIRAVLDNTK